MGSSIEFKKYHGLGNDFIVIDLRFEDSENLLNELTVINIKSICNRNFGIGSDGIIAILPSQNDLDIKMRIFNSDGTEAEMCGNGIRCLVKYLYDSVSDKKEFDIKVETLAGVIKAYCNSLGYIRVDMGEPYFDPKDIPTNLDINSLGIAEGTIVVQDKSFDIFSVGMGNPHLVTYIDDLDLIDISKYGPLLENHPLFPAKTNVHFVKVINKKTIEVEVWERGCGVTFACGTGACASAVISNKLGLCDDKINVRLKGGILNIEWIGDRTSVIMSGEAQFIYKGSFSLDNFHENH